MGVSIDEDEEDFAILADRMIRLMIEVSDEKERRARGIYQETQPYLSMALRADPPAQVPQAAAPRPATTPTTPTTTEPTLPTVSAAPEPDAPAQAETGPVKTLFHDGDSVKISVTTGSSIPARGTDGSDPGLLQLWDSWFDESMRGVTVSGAYTFEDTGKAERFKAKSRHNKLHAQASVRCFRGKAHERNP